MIVESETLMNEQATGKSENMLKIILTGSEKDLLMEEKLQQSGHEVTFVAAGGELTKIGTNFGFKHLKPGINYAQENGFDLVLGIDGASNKISVAVRKGQQENFIVLNLHQLASLLTANWTKNEASGQCTVLKSIHVSDMVENIAGRNGERCINEVIAPGELETLAVNVEISESERLVGFTENQEFYDSRQSFYEIVENIVAMVQDLSNEGKTLYDELFDLFLQYGFYKEKTLIVDFVSDKQKKHLMSTMNEIRKNPRILDDRIELTRIIDYRKGKSINLITQKKLDLAATKADVLRLESSNGTSITFAPTANSMNYYISAKTGLQSRESYPEENKMAEERMMKLIEKINSLLTM